MTNPRKYGASPFSVAVIHGGPGGPGQVAPIKTDSYDPISYDDETIEHQYDIL